MGGRIKGPYWSDHQNYGWCLSPLCDTIIQVLLDVSLDEHKLGVVDLIDGVVGAEGLDALLDTVVDKHLPSD